VRGRERAGADHLAAAAGRVSDGSLPAGDVAGWLGWMAGVLRDEESGICFRSTHGFMSTGSQISWRPPRDRLGLSEGTARRGCSELPCL